MVLQARRQEGNIEGKREETYAGMKRKACQQQEGREAYGRKVVKYMYSRRRVERSRYRQNM
jgi:hypothetical protein